MEPGQRQELLAHAGEPVGLVTDIGDEFPDGIHIHVVLQNGVGQELDGGEGGLQLMGGIGDELPPLLLGLAELIRQVIEFIAQGGQLIVAAHFDLVGVVALPDDAHGLHDPAEPHREDLAENDGKHNDHGDQQHRHGQNVVLQHPDQLSLLGIVFQNIRTACQGVAAEDGGGGAADHHAVVVVDGDDIVAQQGLYHLRKQAKLVTGHGAQGVIYHPSGGIRDDEPGNIQIAQGINGGGCGVGVQNLLLAHSGADQKDLVHQRGVLAAVEDGLAGIGGIIVQQYQHDEGQNHIDRRISELIAAVEQLSGIIS